MEGFPVMAAKIAEANSFKSWAHHNVGQDCEYIYLFIIYLGF